MRKTPVPEKVVESEDLQLLHCFLSDISELHIKLTGVAQPKPTHYYRQNVWVSLEGASLVYDMEQSIIEGNAIRVPSIASVDLREVNIDISYALRKPSTLAVKEQGTVGIPDETIVVPFSSTGIKSILTKQPEYKKYFCEPKKSTILPAAVKTSTKKDEAAVPKFEWVAYLMPTQAHSYYTYLINFPDVNKNIILLFGDITDNSDYIAAITPSVNVCTQIDIIDGSDTVPILSLAASYEKHNIVAYTSNSEDIFDTNDVATLTDHTRIGKKLSELVARFKDEQEDPYVDDSDLVDSPLVFNGGSKEDLEQGIITIYQAFFTREEWNAVGSNTLRVVVKARTEEDGADVDFESMERAFWAAWPTLKEKLENDEQRKYKLEKFKEACSLIVSQNEPAGYSWEYNDGYYDRKSGYDKRPQCINIEVPTPTSAHDIIGAKMTVKTWTASMPKKMINVLVGDTK